jgi:chromosome partitioning protein
MILLVGHLKGGTGKSTLAFNLAVWAAYQMRKAYLLDTDPLHTVSNLIKVREAERHQPVVYCKIAKESQIEAEVEKVKDIFDDIIVDIAAGDVDGFRAALRAADMLLIPLLPGQADVWAINDVMPMLVQARKRRPDIRVMVVINKADTNYQVRETQETEKALSELEGIEFAPVRIAYRVLMRRSLTEGMSVMEWAPNSKSAEEIDLLARTVFARS